jgi:hypothetical protein
LGLKSFHAFRNDGLAVIAVDRVSNIVLISSKCTPLFTDSQFGDLDLLLIVFENHFNVSVYRVVVLLGMLVTVGGAEAIKTFHAYEQSMLSCLTIKDNLLVHESIGRTGL